MKLSFVASKQLPTSRTNKRPHAPDKSLLSEVEYLLVDILLSEAEYLLADILDQVSEEKDEWDLLGVGWDLGWDGRGL